MVLTTGNHLMVAHHEGRRSWPEGLKPHPEEPAVAGVSKDGAHPALTCSHPTSSIPSVSGTTLPGRPPVARRAVR
jgi:hypothetical protein